MSRSKNLVFLIASMIIFGTNGLLVANISLSSAEIVLMRTFLGFIFLLAVVAARRSFSFAELKADIIPATVGGAALGNIGQRNIESAHLVLRKEGVRLLREDVGGTTARTLLFDTESGQACVRSFGKPELIF